MNTFERLQQILLQHYPLQQEAITPDATLEKLEIDSLGVMELFFAIEDEFQISVPNEQRDLKTAGDIADYIEELVMQQKSSQPPSAALPQAGMQAADDAGRAC